MNVVYDTPALTIRDINELSNAIEMETKEYRRLLRLAIRQNRYMRKQDITRLEINAKEWAKYLPLAETSKNRRERLLKIILKDNYKELSDLKYEDIVDLAGSLPDSFKESWMNWRKSISELERQNSLNGILARFCIDMIADEITSIKDDCSDDTKCYGTQGTVSSRNLHSVLTRKA